MSSSLGTLTITSGQKTSFQAPNQGVKAIRIGCESGLHVTISMESGGVQKTLYPSMVDWFEVRPGFTGNIIIQPTTILTNASTFPSTSLVFDAIGLNDADSASQYPITLTRNTNIGNAINTVLGTASAVQQDGQADGTSVVEATPLGDVTTVSILNSGREILGSVNNPGFLHVQGTQDSKHDLMYDASTGILTIQNRIIANLITAVTGNDIGFHVASPNNVIDTVDGINVFSVNSGGANLLTGAFAVGGPINTTFTPVSVNGQTSGTASVYQYMAGGVKRAMVVFANYKNTGNQFLTVPVAFTGRTEFRVYDTGSGHISVNTGGSGGTAVNFDVITALASGGGTVVGQSFLGPYSFASTRGAWDTFVLQLNTSAANGIIIVEGS